eukprot:4980556-Prymnesium_polylepis.1
MKSFSTALASGAMAQLKILYLANNQISDTGMNSFSTALVSGAAGESSGEGVHGLVADHGTHSAHTCLPVYDLKLLLPVPVNPAHEGTSILGGQV